MSNTIKDEKNTGAAKKRGLGRGLGALFEDEEGDYLQTVNAANATNSSDTPGMARRMMGVDQLTPGGFQPRSHFDEGALKELADSIAAHGVLQPLIVRPLPDTTRFFEIIAGERRWRAAMQAQLHEVPVIVMDIDDQNTLEIALIENLQRADLNALEEAQGYARMMEEFGHTQEKLAAALGKSRSHIANMTRLLGLPDFVQDLLRDGKLTAGHARALITAENPEELARTIVEKGLSVRATENLTGGGKNAKKAPKKGAPRLKDVDTLALEKEVSGMLGMNIDIDMKGDGKGGRWGKLSIEFKSLDQLDEILHRLSHFPGRKQGG